MSRTFKQQKIRDPDYRLDDGYVGYEFEKAYTPEGRKFVKRLVNKHNRRVGKELTQAEILHGIKENIYV